MRGRNIPTLPFPPTAHHLRLPYPTPYSPPLRSVRTLRRLPAPTGTWTRQRRFHAWPHFLPLPPGGVSGGAGRLDFEKYALRATAGTWATSVADTPHCTARRDNVPVSADVKLLRCKG